MWKIRKLDEQLFIGAAAKIYEFLDIEPLMPPGRLRLSKLLGRPVMDELRCNCTAIANLLELRDMDCQVHGGQVVFNIRHGVVRFRPWMGLMRDAPPHLWGPRIISTEDKAWGMAWYKKEGAHWPEIRSGVHPALEDLVVSHDEFHGSWEEDMAEIEYEEPETPEDFTCPVCTGTYIDGVIVQINGEFYKMCGRSG